MEQFSFKIRYKLSTDGKYAYGYNDKKEIVSLQETVETYTKAKELVKSIREVIKMTPEYIAELYVNRISNRAASIYQKIAADTNRLVWDKNYSLSLVDLLNGKEEKKE